MSYRVERLMTGAAILTGPMRVGTVHPIGGRWYAYGSASDWCPPDGFATEDDARTALIAAYERGEFAGLRVAS